MQETQQLAGGGDHLTYSERPKTGLIGRVTGPPPQTQQQTYSQVQPTTRFWPFIS